MFQDIEIMVLFDKKKSKFNCITYEFFNQEESTKNMKVFSDKHGKS